MSRENEISVLLIEPMKAPKMVQIPYNLAEMQKLVGGNIQEIMPFDDEVALICNEEGKNEKLPLNRALYTINKDDIIAVSGEVITDECDEDECDTNCEECEYLCEECDNCTLLTDEKCLCDCDYSCFECGGCMAKDDEYIDEEFELRKQIFASHLSQIIADTTKYANDLFGV